ncbi:hypothetical protein [Brunnivagina elsteri]|uniref:hypothetical protein n=1 Tax=Brunnivagina elsteri TaxID=1247191 RepID=UPI001B806E68|nr:hypothetical protein [Calothrix elsteri]
MYTKRDINIKGHGAIDMMAKMTNNAFAESAIAARSTQQFQDLFKEVEFTPAQKASAVQIKKIYDLLIHRAVTISREVEQAPGLKIVATNSQGQQIEIIGLAEKKHPNLFDNRKLDITVVENKSPYNQSQKKWIAISREEALVRDKKVSLLDELKPILKEKYTERNNRGLLHDGEASLSVIPVKSEYFESLLQEKGKNIEVLKKLSDEIDRKFGVECSLGVARKEDIEELYFCVTLPTEVSQQKTAARINDALNFPLDYDQLENGRRTKFIAMPLATIFDGIALPELEEIIDQVESKVKHPATREMETPSVDVRLVVRHRIQLAVSQTEPVKREEWEKQMLKLALACLRENPA